MKKTSLFMLMLMSISLCTGASNWLPLTNQEVEDLVEQALAGSPLTEEPPLADIALADGELERFTGQSQTPAQDQVPVQTHLSHGVITTPVHRAPVQPSPAFYSSAISPQRPVHTGVFPLCPGGNPLMTNPYDVSASLAVAALYTQQQRLQAALYAQQQQNTQTVLVPCMSYVPMTVQTTPPVRPTLATTATLYGNPFGQASASSVTQIQERQSRKRTGETLKPTGRKKRKYKKFYEAITMDDGQEITVCKACKKVFDEQPYTHTNRHDSSSIEEAKELSLTEGERLFIKEQEKTIQATLKKCYRRNVNSTHQCTICTRIMKSSEIRRHLIDEHNIGETVTEEEIKEKRKIYYQQMEELDDTVQNMTFRHRFYVKYSINKKQVSVCKVCKDYFIETPGKHKAKHSEDEIEAAKYTVLDTPTSNKIRERYRTSLNKS